VRLWHQPLGLSWAAGEEKSTTARHGVCSESSGYIPYAEDYTEMEEAKSRRDVLSHGMLIPGGLRASGDPSPTGIVWRFHPSLTFLATVLSNPSRFRRRGPPPGETQCGDRRALQQVAIRSGFRAAILGSLYTIFLRNQIMQEDRGTNQIQKLRGTFRDGAGAHLRRPPSPSCLSSVSSRSPSSSRFLSFPRPQRPCSDSPSYGRRRERPRTAACVSRIGRARRARMPGVASPGGTRLRSSDCPAGGCG
jgi:hypothetical protein